MLSRKWLLRLAAFLTFFTCLGHTMGTLSSTAMRPPEVLQGYEAMKSVLVPMPIGPSQSLYDVMRGANLCLSLYLLLAGIFFVILSSAPSEKSNQKILMMNSLGMLGVAILSVIYFFPLPAICTGLAGVFGVFAVFKKAA